MGNGVAPDKRNGCATAAPSIVKRLGLDLIGNEADYREHFRTRKRFSVRQKIIGDLHGVIKNARAEDAGLTKHTEEDAYHCG